MGVVPITDLKPTFQCDKCKELYHDSVAHAKIRKRAFPCGQKCPCGGTFCLHVNGVPVKKYQGGEQT